MRGPAAARRPIRAHRPKAARARAARAGEAGGEGGQGGGEGGEGGGDGGESVRPGGGGAAAAAASEALSIRDLGPDAQTVATVQGCNDSDRVARQLCEAATQENDPFLRAALWDEYNEYKKLITSR